MRLKAFASTMMVCAAIAACGGGGGGTGGGGGDGTTSGNASSSSGSSSGSGGGNTCIQACQSLEQHACITSGEDAACEATCATASSASIGAFASCVIAAMDCASGHACDTAFTMAGTSSSSSSSSSGGCPSGATDGAPMIHDTDATSQPMPPMSTAQGGTIPSGTFFQTQQIYYQGDTNYNPTDTHQSTLVFDAGQGTVTLLIGPSVFGGTFSISGTSLTLNMTCPMPGQLTDPYTYSAGTLTLYNYAKNEVDVFQKQ